MVNFSLAGVICPRMVGPKKDDEEKSNDEPQPFALEAKNFVELRLLNRDVNLSIEGVDKNGVS